MTFGERLTAFLSGPRALSRLVVVFCVGVCALALVVRYPQAFGDANGVARANARLDFYDLQFGGGNSVMPDQDTLIQAARLIPRDSDYDIVIGAPREGWTDLTAPFAETFMTYFLLPRRPRDGAEWIVCVGCEPDSIPEADVVWEGGEGGVIFRRRG